MYIEYILDAVNEIPVIYGVTANGGKEEIHKAESNSLDEFLNIFDIFSELKG